MKEAERIARKVLNKEMAKKVEDLSEEKQENMLPNLQKLEEFMDSFPKPEPIIEEFCRCGHKKSDHGYLKNGTDTCGKCFCPGFNGEAR